MKWNWGTGITIFYIIFASTMISLVIKSTSYDHSLVQENYYQADLAYQEHIDKLQNSQSQPMLIQHRGGNDFITLRLLDDSLENISGIVTFFRPSDKGQDVELPLQLNASGQQIIPTDQLSNGFWRVKLDWQADGKTFYKEVELVL